MFERTALDSIHCRNIEKNHSRKRTVCMAVSCMQFLLQNVHTYLSGKNMELPTDEKKLIYRVLV